MLIFFTMISLKVSIRLVSGQSQWQVTSSSVAQAVLVHQTRPDQTRPGQARPVVEWVQQQVRLELVRAERAVVSDVRAWWSGVPAPLYLCLSLGETRSEQWPETSQYHQQHINQISASMGFCSAVTLAFATIFSLVAAALLAISFSTDNWITVTVQRQELKVRYQSSTNTFFCCAVFVRNIFHLFCVSQVV